MDESNKRDQIDEIDTGLNKVRLEKVRLKTAVMSYMPIYGSGAQTCSKGKPDLAQT